MLSFAFRFVSKHLVSARFVGPQEATLVSLTHEGEVGHADETLSLRKSTIRWPEPQMPSTEQDMPVRRGGALRRCQAPCRATESSPQLWKRDL